MNWLVFVLTAVTFMTAVEGSANGELCCGLTANYVASWN